MKDKVVVEIDERSGFCFGVVNAIRKAEDALGQGQELYCLGDIVHNNKEVERLENLGLRTIERDSFDDLKEGVVLLRAHGEPPSTYLQAEYNNTRLIDATCPVVLRLQRNVRKAYEKSLHDDGQVVIFGKLGHAEVNGLIGQTDGRGIVITSIADVAKIDVSRPVRLFSQTTMMVDKFLEIKQYFEARMSDSLLEVYNTVCKQVSGRIDDLHQFCHDKDVVVFVSGKKSSNGRVLFAECKKANESSYFVTGKQDVDTSWFNDAKSVGVCGATSTPDWLMKDVGEYIKECCNE